MTLLEELKQSGVNVDEGLERVMGDRDLYEMMLGMFVDSVRDNPIALEEFDGELEPLIQKVHLLKGVTGNLSLTPVYNGYQNALTLLRGGQAAAAREELERLLPIQANLIDCIQRSQSAWPHPGP